MRFDAFRYKFRSRCHDFLSREEHAYQYEEEIEYPQNRENDAQTKNG